MAYDDLRFDFVQMFREALVPPAPSAGRTCDCPIAFPESLEMCTQIHRYGCPNAPTNSKQEIVGQLDPEAPISGGAS